MATSKIDKAQHGIGLTPIEEITGRYDGRMTLNGDDHQLTFDALLNNMPAN